MQITLSKTKANIAKNHRAARIFVLVVLLFSSDALCKVDGADTKLGIQVGPNVQVSVANRDLAHDELLACADPTNSNRLIVGSILRYTDRSDWITALYASSDGGKTWSTGIATPIGDKGTDPACAYGLNGDAYFLSLVSPAGVRAVYLYRSNDGGQSWTGPFPIGAKAGFDRPYIAVDRSGGKYNGRIYVTAAADNIFNIDWREERDRGGIDSRYITSGVDLYRSADGGQTFLGPVKSVGMSERRSEGFWNANSVVLSDGTLLSLLQLPDHFGESREVIELKVMFSFDGGESYHDIAKVRDYSTDCPVAEYKETIPNIAVDPGSSFLKDRLYVAWNECKKDSRGQPNGEASMVLYSPDQGKTWSAPVLVDSRSESEKGRDQYQTTVAVSNDGVVGVMWYEGFQTASSEGYWVRFTASLDGGETWLRSVKVSEAPNMIGGSEKWSFDLLSSSGGPFEPIRISLLPNRWEASGHTAGLVADANGIFHAFWVDDRTGIKQLWTSQLTVSGSVIRNGAKEVAGLNDVSSKVRIELGSAELDRPSGLASINLRLKNVSQQTISGPLKMRILRMSSEFGVPKITDAENGLTGNGAILNLSDLLAGNVLKPNDETVVKLLRFKLDNLGSIRSEGKWHSRILEIESRIFGKTEQ